jgi:hypothetical protein
MAITILGPPTPVGKLPYDGRLVEIVLKFDKYYRFQRSVKPRPSFYVTFGHLLSQLKATITEALPDEHQKLRGSCLSITPQWR